MATLIREGSRARLIVNGQDWLILAGELGNSNASSVGTLDAQWVKLRDLGLNTVLVPVYWELLEPQAGQFDFTLLEAILDGARRHQLKVILLWFGAFKNSMSCYVPAWVKRDPERFTPVRLPNGERTQILSIFSSELLEADRRAFVTLMSQLRKLDEQDETVIMVQVENEIGMLGAAREHGRLANAAFESAVPEALMQHLEQLEPGGGHFLRERWTNAGGARSGTWVEVFGAGLATEEIFTAWHYARYVDSVASAGKAAYPLPLFVNAALNPPGKDPGDYPSGGPLPHLHEVWKLAAPSVDLLSPDIYFPEFEYWVSQYVKADNPLFIPEIQRSRDSGAQAVFAIGELCSLGFSPFAIEWANGDEADTIRSCYALLRQIAPTLLRHRWQGDVRAILLDKQIQRREFAIGDTIFHAAHDFTCPWTSGDSKSDTWPCVACLVIRVTDAEFILAGMGTIFTFTDSADSRIRVGLLSVEEGRYDSGRWVTQRWLNGDETHQGRHLRIPYGTWGVQRLSLYRY